MKTCTVCHVEKPLDDFYDSKRGTSGKLAFCKKCHNEKSRAYSATHKEQISAHTKAYWAIHKDEMGKKRREAYPQIKHLVFAYQNKNRKHINEVKKEYRESHKDELAAAFKQWADNNRESYLARRRAKNKLRMETDPQYRLNRSISVRLRESLLSGKGGAGWEEIVGYTLSDLKKHLEKKFKEGMTWGNYGEWHVDHKIPISAFNFVSPDDLDFKRCWELENLQPLWAVHNISKGARLEHPFQPSLVIAV